MPLRIRYYSASTNLIPLPCGSFLFFLTLYVYNINGTINYLPSSPVLSTWSLQLLVYVGHGPFFNDIIDLKSPPSCSTFCLTVHMLLRVLKILIYVTRILLCFSATPWPCLLSYERHDCIFWDVAPCSLVEINGRFKRTYCLYLHGRRVSKARNQQDFQS
jgi:hypothetical protein